MNTETALLITTAIMALGAITFAALTMAFDRSHHRKSVRPFCNLLKHVACTGVSFSIQNAGMGPMLIQKIILLKNRDDPVETGIPLAQALPSQWICDGSRCGDTDEYALAPMCELKLLECPCDTADSGAMTLLEERLNGYFLCIRYTDIYDDSYEKKMALTG
ncbi:MAG: hypothetical protein P4L75_04455 [Clostridia bacterium]|nr:hypothetical protein [Clostridia bacterium]MDR3644983.1 hypothetical protein [Clostridia bacterium]